MQFKKIAFFVISATILFTGCDSKKEEEQKVKNEVVKKTQTKYKLTTTNNEIIELEKTKDKFIFKDLQGKVVLLNFWATWCPPCKAEIPHLNNLQEKYKDSFKIISIAMEQRDGTMTSTEKMNIFIKDHQIKYTITNTKENYLVSEALGGVRIIPTMFMIDPTGKIIQKYVGVVPEEMMELDINRALGK